MPKSPSLRNKQVRNSYQLSDKSMSHKLGKNTSDERVAKMPLHKQIALGEKPKKPKKVGVKKQ